MKNNKPLTGAMHIVGKNNQGQRIVLPTIILKNRVLRDFMGILRYNLQDYAKRLKKDFKSICNDYKEIVNTKINYAQQRYKELRKKELLA